MTFRPNDVALKRAALVHAVCRAIERQGFEDSAAALRAGHERFGNYRLVRIAQENGVSVDQVLYGVEDAAARAVKPALVGVSC